MSWYSDDLVLLGSKTKSSEYRIVILEYLNTVIPVIL